MKIEAIMRRSPVIPVMVIEHLDQAVPLAEALVEGGLPVLEVTLRSEVAIQAVSEIARNVSGAIVGVGTVTRAEHFTESADAGAAFAVSPGLTGALAEASCHHELPFLPGVFTPSDVMRAQSWGFNALKLFPAQQAGGIGMLKALAGPLPGVSFCPTGGIGADDFVDFLDLPNVACVGGSWVCPATAIASRDWEQVARLARQVHEKLDSKPGAS
jgi:2-dehydro-3-deoxyphosphogluconate aldolase/(4S)-4-hydroxy-2-oxoglutarate aldolase